jgi:hypothetical protein
MKTLYNVGYSRNDSLSNFLNLITKRLDLIQKDEEILRRLQTLFQNELFYIFETGSSEQIKGRFWHILNDCLEKIEPKLFFKTFASNIRQILKMPMYDFMYSSQYQSFLLKVLQKAEHI